MGLLHMNCLPELFQLETQISLRIKSALVPLLEAIDYADQSSSDCWDFAVEVEILVSLGLSLNDFRWLVRNCLVEHKRETTRESDNGRAFQPTGDLVFPGGTCFVLSEKGVVFSRQTCGIANTNASDSSGKVDSDARIDVNNTSIKSQHNGRHAPKSARPCWDSERRVLTLNGTIVKHFKWAAENQEAILCVFEEENWSSRIDDPLKPCPEQNSKRRLSDTIKCLNRKQSNALIHFRGDGTGEGVIWELCQCHGASGSD